MPRRLVFVESNTTGSGMRALRTARALGVVPVLLTGSPDRYPGLADIEPGTVEVVRCDTNSTAELRAVLGRFPREELAGVTTTSEFYLTAAAELAVWLGLPGNPPAAVRTCRDKAAVRRALAAAGLAQPRFTTVDGEAAVGPAVAAVGLPCVVKPVADSGSHLVRVCVTADEAREQVRRVLAERTNVRGQPAAGLALVEELLTGQEVSIEMFGRHCVGITAKELTGFPHCVERQHLYPAALGPADTGRVVRYAERVLAATGIRHGATHLEARLGPHGPALVEINARPAGGMIPTLVELVDGVDLVAEHLRACLGQAPALPAGHSGCAGIRFLTAARAGQLVDVTGVAAARQVPGVVTVEITKRNGAKVAPPRDAYDRLGFVIANGGDHDEVTRTLAAAVARLRVEVRPEHLVSMGGGT